MVVAVQHGNEHGGHVHGHGSASRSFGTAFAIGTLLNIALVAIQVMAASSHKIVSL